ncbi:MAG: hypothetical protein HRU17_03440 [Polyangiaceae bacterium]|nr:hypothetical protein [Polyangiaceae bacterium]
MSHSTPPQSSASSAAFGASRRSRPSARLSVVDAEVSKIYSRSHPPNPESLPLTDEPGQLLAKVSRAEILLRSMGISDPRARLLQTAICRRDEALLDALMRDIKRIREAGHAGNVT